MNEQSIRWDDLQIVLAIAETGSLSGASRRLGISHATVFRRLNDMERNLGVRLFDRGRSGYTATPLGEDLAGSAERVEGEILGAERRIAGNDFQLAGTIRLATTDTLYAGLLAGLIADFRRQHPGIQFEVVISNQQQNLSKREADIAIRPTNNPPEMLVGRRIGTIRQAVYGQKMQWGDAQAEHNVTDLAQEQWITADPEMGDSPMERWLLNNVPEHNCQYRINSVRAMRTAVAAGSGIAVLPCYVGDADDKLCRLTPPIDELETGLWVLTHRDLRRVTRIRRLMNEVADQVVSALPA